VTPALGAQVLVSKCCHHIPLYHYAQIFARHGVELERSTLAGWAGGARWWFEALDDRLRKDVFASDHLFAGDTPVPVLDPGRGRTKIGRPWFTRASAFSFASSLPILGSVEVRIAFWCCQR
jgi:transposase